VAFIVPTAHINVGLTIFCREAPREAKSQIESQLIRGDSLFWVVQIERRNLAEDVFSVAPPNFNIGRSSKVDHVNSEEHGEGSTQDCSVNRVEIIVQPDIDAE